MAIGEVTYKDTGAIKAECRDFGEMPGGVPPMLFRRYIPKCAVTRHCRPAAVRNQHYDTERKYLEALAEALQIKYKEIVQSGFGSADRTSPDLALERHVLLQEDQPISKFLSFVEDVITVINAALRNIPP